MRLCPVQGCMDELLQLERLADELHAAIVQQREQEQASQQVGGWVGGRVIESVGWRAGFWPRAHCAHAPTTILGRQLLDGHAKQLDCAPSCSVVLLAGTSGRANGPRPLQQALITLTAVPATCLHVGVGGRGAAQDAGAAAAAPGGAAGRQQGASGQGGRGARRKTEAAGRSAGSLGGKPMGPDDDGEAQVDDTPVCQLLSWVSASVLTLTHFG